MHNPANDKKRVRPFEQTVKTVRFLYPNKKPTAEAVG
jgi:hypothetical protein